MSHYNGPDHTVTVTTYPYRSYDVDNDTWLDVVDVDHEIEHPAECDALKYGELCALDEYIATDGFEYSGIPNEPGTYTVNYWSSGPDYFGEYDAGVHVERRPDPKLTVEKAA